ncbi:hypothetical protein [Nocardia harenae]|uniref:hypothetical protein n=1 Tax=Nocardia harenae TaxID=358707 RepID=UPI0008335F6B|nr:hypothetical protein [Nocardia harenae]
MAKSTLHYGGQEFRIADGYAELVVTQLKRAQQDAERQGVTELVAVDLGEPVGTLHLSVSKYIPLAVQVRKNSDEKKRGATL